MRRYSERQAKFERDFNYEVLAPAIFAAFVLSIEARRDEDKLTQAELAKRAAKDKTRISKLLSAPGNWTVKTISDLCAALDVTFEFGLVDNCHPLRVFTGTGTTFFGPVETINTTSIQECYEDDPIKTLAQLSGASVGTYTLSPHFVEVRTTLPAIQMAENFSWSGTSLSSPRTAERFQITGTSHQ